MSLAPAPPPPRGAGLVHALSGARQGQGHGTPVMRHGKTGPKLFKRNPQYWSPAPKPDPFAPQSVATASLPTLSTTIQTIEGRVNADRASIMRHLEATGSPLASTNVAFMSMNPSFVGGTSSVDFPPLMPPQRGLRRGQGAGGKEDELQGAEGDGAPRLPSTVHDALRARAPARELRRLLQAEGGAAQLRVREAAPRGQGGCTGRYWCLPVHLAAQYSTCPEVVRQCQADTI